MIVTIATHAPDDAAGIVAENLALLRVRSGRHVLLMDATSRPEFDMNNSLISWPCLSHWRGRYTRRRYRKPGRSIAPVVSVAKTF